MPYTDESQGLGVLVPYEGIHVGVESLAHVVLLAGCEVINAKAVAVALISVASHALPSHILAVGRELRVLVITRIVLQVLGSVDSLILHRLCSVDGRLYVSLLLADVLCLARTYIIYIDV